MLVCVHTPVCVPVHVSVCMRLCVCVCTHIDGAGCLRTALQRRLQGGGGGEERGPSVDCNQIKGTNHLRLLRRLQASNQPRATSPQSPIGEGAQRDPPLGGQAWGTFFPSASHNYINLLAKLFAPVVRGGLCPIHVIMWEQADLQPGNMGHTGPGVWGAPGLGSPPLNSVGLCPTDSRNLQRALCPGCPFWLTGMKSGEGSKEPQRKRELGREVASKSPQGTAICPQVAQAET